MKIAMASPTTAVRHLRVYQWPPFSKLPSNCSHPLGDLIQSHSFKHHLTLQEINCKGEKEREEEPICFKRHIDCKNVPFWGPDSKKPTVKYI